MTDREAPLAEKRVDALSHSESLSPEDVLSTFLIGPAPSKRLIEPSEVASYVRCLCSDDAGAITGSARIDLGWTAP